MTIDARALRAAQPDAVPCGVARSQPFKGRLEVLSERHQNETRAKLVDRDGQPYYQVDGNASVTETPYEMFDFAGPYNEIVSAGAFDKTLAANPDVMFLLNHRGLGMARTTNGSLKLSVDDQGLQSRAYLNPKRQDVKDLISAIDDGIITEMSFAFVIVRGKWSPDYTEYRIEEVDLDRGDVSAVNYGANPYTSIAARSREILNDLDHLPAGAARAALERLNSRQDLADTPPDDAESADAEPQGRSVALVRQLMKL